MILADLIAGDAVNAAFLAVSPSVGDPSHEWYFAAVIPDDSDPRWAFVWIPDPDMTSRFTDDSVVRMPVVEIQNRIVDDELEVELTGECLEARNHLEDALTEWVGVEVIPTPWADFVDAANTALLKKGAAR